MDHHHRSIFKPLRWITVVARQVVRYHTKLHSLVDSSITMTLNGHKAPARRNVYVIFTKCREISFKSIAHST